MINPGLVSVVELGDPDEGDPLEPGVIKPGRLRPLRLGLLGFERPLFDVPLGFATEVADAGLMYDGEAALVLL